MASLVPGHAFTLQSSSQSRFCAGESPFLKLRSACSESAGLGSRKRLIWRAEGGKKECEAGKGSNASVGDGRRKDASLNLERRELLAASVAGVSTLWSHPAVGVPVTPPDLSKCEPATVAVSGQPTLSVTCCLPEGSAKVFTPTPGSVLKVRKPAQKVDAAYIKKYNKAYELMRALPDTDPRSFKQQADVHCAFCNGAYPSPQNSSAELQIHFSYIFFPWHRFYLYFHERILASLINDPSFALPFWNWDDQKFGGNVMPLMFTQSDTYASLYDPKRNQNHLPPSINTLSLSDNSANLTDSQIIADNLSVMYQSTVKPTTATLFMGAAPLFGDFNDTAAGGTLELGPHTAIHVWAGDPRETYGENMGNFYSAGRDPLFYSHHANVDRMWTVWDSLPKRRKDLYTDSDFLNSSFVFYNEKSELVQVYVKDCLDTKKQLGVTYEAAPGDKLWLQLEPKPLSKVKGLIPKGKDKVAEFGSALKGKKPQDLTKAANTLTSLVTRPTNLTEYATSKGLSEADVEEVLILQDVQVPKTSATHLAVFINLPDADSTTSLDCAEYVGSYVNVPHIGMDMSNSRRINVKFSISDNITKLGIEDQEKITVTVVAKVLASDAAAVTIAGYKIVYV